MSCGSAGKKRYVYTGNQSGFLNHTGDYNFVAGGPTGSSLSAGTTVGLFYANTLNRRIWERDDAVFGDQLLDAAYPTINLQWFAEIYLDTNVVFKVSNRSFYVQDSAGLPRYYDARVDRPPSVNVTTGEWLNSNYQVSDLTLVLNNRDGYFNKYLPHGSQYRQWSGAKVIVKVGFGEKYDNYFTLFEGQVTIKEGLTTTRDAVEVRCYDKLELDEIPIPPNAFSIDRYPDIGEGESGKPVPLVYGDWTEDVPAWGAVNALCTNGGDAAATEYVFKVSDIALQSIDSAWLHRGDRKEDTIAGPIQFDFGSVAVSLSEGAFTVPVGVDVFNTEFVLVDGQSAGAGSGLNAINAKDATINFVNQSIQVGDRVLKKKTGEYATISVVANFQLTLSGGVTFADGDEYAVLTKKYKFLKGDSISVVCKGKSLNLVSVTRLQDVEPAVGLPNGLSVSFDATYWVADDTTQKIYNITFGGVVLSTIDYADVDPALTTVSGISVASDNFMWISDPTASKLYRFNLSDGTTSKSFDTAGITGIGTLLGNITGIVAKTDNNLWIVDQATSTFYEINWTSDSNRFVVTSFTKVAFDASANDLSDVGYDEQTGEVIAVDRGTLKAYRLNETNGALVSSIDLAASVSDDITLPSGVSVGQDGTLFFLDAAVLTIYNYNDLSYASSNPCFIARDVLQKFGGHTYDEFDISWNFTARQLSEYKCRAVLSEKANIITFINGLLRQYNVVFFPRFGKFALFWITFDNFRTNGRLVKEKDIQIDSFRPGKETNQYFNSATATYDKRDFTAKSSTSDTYVSPAGIAFASREANRKLDLPNVYKRTDLDRLMPLFVRLAVPEPEFVSATFGFRLLRTQIHDFLTLNFDGDVNIVTGEKESGRRFENVPCMVRQIRYDLGPMTVAMKLWSLGNTPFSGWTPEGRTVGGDGDTIVLTNLGRLGRVSPIGTITAYSSNTVTLQNVAGQNAETRSSTAGLAWKPSYRVALINGATKEILQTLTIQSASGQVITFDENITAAMSNTIVNNAGFVSSGVYLQYANYDDQTEEQRGLYGSFARPATNYPNSRTQELEEQRGGVHSFDDGGIPYILYPNAFTSY